MALANAFALAEAQAEQLNLTAGDDCWGAMTCISCRCPVVMRYDDIPLEPHPFYDDYDVMCQACRCQDESELETESEDVECNPPPNGPDSDSDPE